MMNTFISGERQYDFVSKFNYVREAGTCGEQRAAETILQELKKEKPNIKLLLIGDGKLKEGYQQYIKNNDLENEIKLLGKRQDINELLSITDVYLASSKREGLPVNVMEAMYKGIPIIATDNRGHRAVSYTHLTLPTIA